MYNVSGSIIKVHEFGNGYAIVEYNPYLVVNNRVTSKIDEATVAYMPHVNDESTRHVYANFDLALLDLLAVRHDGLNSQFVYFASRMLGIKE